VIYEDSRRKVPGKLALSQAEIAIAIRTFTWQAALVV